MVQTKWSVLKPKRNPKAFNVTKSLHSDLSEYQVKGEGRYSCATMLVGKIQCSPAFFGYSFVPCHYFTFGHMAVIKNNLGSFTFIL